MTGTSRDPDEPLEAASAGQSHVNATRGEPTQIGRFTVLGRIGSGGMGLVYAGYDSELDRKVAIKLLRPHVVQSGRVTLGQARLLREAQAMARLSHPNVVTVHEVGVFEEQVFIAMEFLSGVTLKTWLRRAKRPWREVVEVFVQAGRGLAAAHAAGLIHRDFKPDNVMVSVGEVSGRVERVRVFDFGVVQEFREAALRHTVESSHSSMPVRTPPHETEERAKRRAPSHDSIARVRARGLPSQSGISGEEAPFPTPDSSLGGESWSDIVSLTAAGALVGTPMYMAPEQYMQAADARSDQFSFCVALFEALYRRRPFIGDSAGSLQRAKISGQIRSRPAGADVPNWLHQIVLRGLSRDPARRFANMEALLEELQRERIPLWRRALRPALAVAGSLGVGLVLAFSLARADPCAGVGDAASIAWGAARREAVEEAFLATGRTYAATTFATVDAALSRYGTTWSERRVEHCASAEDGRAPHLVSRGLCLELRLRELSALTELLTRADAQVVDHAPMAVARLTPVDQCDDIASIVARTPPPPPPELASVDFTVRLAEVRALLESGKYALGLEAARAASSESRRLGYLPWLAEALLLEGLLQARSGAARAAEAALIDAVVAAEESRHDEVATRARIELVRVIGVDQERHDEGQRWGRLAEAGLRRIGTPPLEAVELAGHLGQLAERRGDLPAAQAHYERAEAMALRDLPEGHALQATVRVDLAGCKLARGHLTEAAQIYEEALALRRRLLGPQHPEVAEVLAQLGSVAWANKDVDRAEALTREALAICSGPDRCGATQRAGVLFDLARIEASRGHLEEAERLTLRALDLYTSVYGDDHSRVAAVYEELGDLAKELGRRPEARSHYQRALEISRRRHADGHPEVGALLFELGALELEERRWTEAREYFRSALAAHERGEREGEALARLLEGDGVAALRLGDHASAVQRHRRALAIYQRDFGDRHPDVVRVRTNLVEAYIAAGEPERAAELAELQLTALGGDGAESSWLRLLLARAIAGSDRPQARRLAEEALAALRFAPGREEQAAEAAAFVKTLSRPR